MGNTDSIPVISQAKSAVQAIAGDTDGARKTQENFLRGCPIVSQGTSLVQAISGDEQGARDTQMYFVNNVSNMADAVPVVGHIKGGIHYACGDKEGGDNAMKSASRTVGVVAGGIGGGILLGPAGAIAGGIAGGAALDGVITGVESAVEGEYRPYGHVQNFTRAINGELDAGSYFDWAMTPVFDGIGGRAYSKLYNSIRAKIADRGANSSFRDAIKKAVADGEITLKEGESVTSLADHLKTQAKDLKTAVDNSNLSPGTRSVGTVVIDVEGNQHVGFSFKLREAAQIDAFDGQVPTAQQILENRLPGRAPSLRGAATGQPQCAEIHALHQHHRANGLTSNPTRTISIAYDGQTTTAVARCGNCMKVGRYVNMGDVLTDPLNGTQIPLDNASIKASLGLMAPCEDCCHDHED